MGPHRYRQFVIVIIRKSIGACLWSTTKQAK